MVAKMTRRERVMRTIRMKEVDRIAKYDILQNDAAIEYYAGEPLMIDGGNRIKGRAIGRCLDMTRYPYGPMKPRREIQPDGSVRQYERWTSWLIERPFHNLEELCPWIKKRIAHLEQWQPDHNFIAEHRRNIKQFLEYFASGTGDCNDLPVLVIESPVGVDVLYTMVGLELFSELTVEDPKLMEEWLEAHHQAELRRVEAIADPKLTPIVLTYDDIAGRNGTIFSPAWLRRHEIPRLQRLIAAWHSRDTLCLFHSDGNLDGILDDLVRAGIDGLNPIETIAEMHLGKIRTHYPHLFLAGGIDVSQLMAFGTPQQVHARCEEAMEETKGIGYFMGSTTELFTTIPLANVRAMLEFSQPEPVRVAAQVEG